VQPLGSSQHFMEPEGSLPSSQELGNEPSGSIPISDNIAFLHPVTRHLVIVFRNCFPYTRFVKTLKTI
jgi:hypothetical protein